MVNITSLEEMEYIISRNRSLLWEGWDVLEVRRSPAGASRSDGIRIDGVWYTHRRIQPSESGWRVPKRYV